MRTKEEQISEVFQNGDSGLALMYQGDFTKHILEAERRAEQRVRAEIGRDSERLEFISTLGECLIERDSLGEWTVWKHTGPNTNPINIGESVCSIRDAIDTAREIVDPEASHD